MNSGHLREEAFVKLHGLGNDFVVLDRREDGRDIDEATARWLCDRRLGIGADGVLVLLPSTRAAARMVVHNADGSVPEMCGNGLRCAVKFLLERMPERPTSLNVETGAGVLSCVPSWGPGGVDEVEIAMGPARLVAPHLPSGATGTPFLGQPVPSMPTLVGSAVSMGNPHLVLFDVPLEKAAELGPLLEHAQGFPKRTNVEFVQKADGGLKVVVWERGVGLTRACGTGACAAVAVATCLGHLAPEQWVSVWLPGGALSIWVQGDLSQVRLRGPVTFVFSGTCRVASWVPPSP